MELDIHTS